jgi:hypothetical protein
VTLYSEEPSGDQLFLRDSASSRVVIIIVCKCSMQTQHSSHQLLIMETNTVSEMSNTNSALMQPVT